MPPRPTGGAGGDVAADWEKHPVVKILLAQTSVAGIRISIHKDYWDELKNVADCPPTTEDEPGPDPTMWPRIVGTLKRWQNQKERKLRVAWYDTEQTNCLQSMVDSDFNVKFEKYADGRDPPRGRGDGAKGVEPAAALEAEVTFTAMYTVGTVDQMLTWSQMSKEGVRVDPRKDERFKPKIKSGHIKDINTPYKMVKLMLPPKWLSRMEKYINQRLTGLNHKNRKTTQGECERFLWYMVALAIHSGIPLEEAWRVSPKALMPALHLGRFGMSFKRFKKLRHLMGQCFDLAGENMDMKDPYRYCRFWPEEYNEHMQDIMTPGWILAPDESMSQFKPTLSGVSDTEPGVHPDDWDRIPNLDWVSIGFRASQSRSVRSSRRCVMAAAAPSSTLRCRRARNVTHGCDGMKSGDTRLPNASASLSHGLPQLLSACSLRTAGSWACAPQRRCGLSHRARCTRSVT
jgi:hypothetical protein